MRRSLPWLFAIAVACWGQAARAQDPFEIQVYDAEVLPFGEAMAEFHVISKPSVTNPPPGVTARDPGLFHLTAEPQIGIGRDFESALYVETSLWPDGSYHVSGAKLRFKWKLAASDGWPVKLAINAEIGEVDPNSDSYPFAGELRPILTTTFWNNRCRLYVNANLGVPLGHDWRVGPEFEPQAKFNCSVITDIAPGLEYYTSLGPLFDWLPLHQQEHFLFYTIDVYRWPKAEISVGVGEPLTRVSGAWTLNANLGIQLP